MPAAMKPRAETVDRAGAAALIGESEDWFARHWRALVAEGNFPAPLPKPGHPRWSRANIRRWIRDPQGWNRAPAAPTHTPQPFDLHDQAARLAARTTALADAAE